MRTMKTILIIALLCGAVGPVFGQKSAKELESQFIAVVQSTNAEYKAKFDACRELARIGTVASVPALVALLPDEKLSHMARYALETLPDPSVDEAFRSAMGKLKGRQLVGVIGSVGVRRDVKAVGALAGFLKDAAPDVVQVSARSLGLIGGAEATKFLESALAAASPSNRLSFCEGLFRCAEGFAAAGKEDKAIAIYDGLRKLNDAPHQVRTAAWRGSIITRGKDGLPLLLEALRGTDNALATAALRIGIEMKAPGVSKALADELVKTAADRQVSLCSVLGKRGDAVALPALMALAKSGEKGSRLAALRAAGEIGGAGVAELFASMLNDADADVAQTAGAGLAALSGGDADAVVIRSLDSQDAALKLKMIEMVRQRRLVAAMPSLLKSMEDKDEGVRTAATRSFGELSGAGEFPRLLERIEKSSAPSEIAAMEKALAMICGGATKPEGCAQKLGESLSRAGQESKLALLRVLGVMGGGEALQVVRKSVNDSNKEVHTTAIRVISEWKSADAAPVLLELAKGAATPVDKVLSLRGYLGMAARKDIAQPERLAICRESKAMIQRDDEKLLLLGALANMADASSMDLAVPYLDDAAVKRDAVAAVMAIAEKREKKQNTALAREALAKIVKVAADNPAVVKRAEELLKQSETE